MLWVRGTLPVRPEDMVAVVGSRASTEYGRQVAGDLAAKAAELGKVVVSGGAAGIDAAAHAGALQARGSTLVVAAGGAGRVYPQGHRTLFERAAGTGAVVWEFPRSVSLTKRGFLVRNRLIAALAGTTVVVEAAERSGALNTGRTAADLGRLVLAVPGPVHSLVSGGCHRAIADGWAAILLGAADLRDLVEPVPV
jgi:DNA processing protein